MGEAFLGLLLVNMRNIFTGLLFGAMLFSVGNFVTAQDRNQNVCGSDEVYLQQESQDPSIRIRREQFEKEFQEYLLNNQISNSAAKNGTMEGEWGLRTIYTIPCVIHVVHDGDSGTPDEISEAQVLSQFSALFENYRRVPFSVGYGGGVDMQIEFSLASIDPDGNPTNGITYHVAKDLVSVNKDSEDAKLKDLGVWDRRQYLNIWTVTEIKGAGNKAEILGYAQFPEMNAKTDGIVLRYLVAGKIGFGAVGTVDEFKYNFQGKTGVHEAGHWLNLRHTFEDGCSEATCSGGGDKVCDTPPTAEENFGFGESRQNTCTKDRPDMPDNLRNFMDYLSDEGCNLFTAQQKARAFFTLNSPSYLQRNALWREENLKRTGAGKYKQPIADFYTEATPGGIAGCVGAPVKFYDYSAGSPDKFEWAFDGGTPSTSTEMHPTVTYAKKGTYKVKLTVTNASGKSHTTEKTKFITITDEVRNLPFSENFQSNTFPPSGWSVRNYDEANQRIGKTWVRNSGLECLQIRCGRYSDYNQIDDILLPNLNMVGADNPQLSFRYAYVPMRDKKISPNSPLLFTDSLEIWASENCGANWTLVYKKGGSDLSSTSVKETDSEISEPFLDQWKNEIGCLKSFSGKSNVLIRIRSINGFGNNIFIDDIKIENASADKICYPVSIDERFDHKLIQNVTISPNPFTSETNLIFDISENTNVSWSIIDLQGRELQMNSATYLNKGTNKIILNPELPSGIYILKINKEGQYWKSLKLIKE